MERRVMQLLVVNDDDLECNCDSITLEGMNISNVGFSPSVLDRFDMVVYKGRKGQKILKSSCTSIGIIG